MRIYYINDNSFILFESSNINIIKDNSIIYTISSFVNLCIISQSKFLALSLQGYPEYVIYHIYDINSESDFNDDSPTYKTYTTTKEYKNFKCQKFSISHKNYIFCLMTFIEIDDTYITYYNILDDSLNEIVAETEFTDDPLPKENNQYIFMIQFSDNIIIALLAKYYEDCSDFFCNSYLISIEINDNFNNNKKAEINFKMYIGRQQIYLEKIGNTRIAIVFPEDYELLKFNIKIFSYIDNNFNEIKTFQIQSTNEYAINSMRIFNINSEIAITYSQENWDEEDEIGLTFFVYLTIPKCQNFQISENMNIIKNIDFGNYILDNGEIEPETKNYKIKFESTNIDIYYDGEIIILNNFYNYDKITFNTGNIQSNYEAIYYVYNENEYGDGNSCKITFNINKQGEISDEIQSKINELKLDFKQNAMNNIIFESDNYKIQFYNTSVISQQKAKNYLNISNIDLKNCEKTLKEKYNIPSEEVLIIIKVDLLRQDTKSIQVEYEIYSESLNKLDLNYCINDNIIITIPYNLENELLNKVKLGQNEGYDILNGNDSFYNDICTPFSSEYSTDITLEDRKIYYYSPELFCEKNCFYSSYNIYNLKVDCECSVKLSMVFDNITRTFEVNKLNSDFYEKNSNTNIKVFKCLKKGFQNFVSNVGAWIFLILIICHIICLLIIFIFGPKYLNMNDSFKNGIIMDIKMVENLENIKKNKEPFLFDEGNINNEDINSKKEINIDNINNEEKKEEGKTSDLTVYSRNIINNENKNKHSIINSNIANSTKKLETFDKIENPPSQMDKLFTEIQINEMSYKFSLIYEKRKYFQCYISLLKYYHLFVFTFTIKEKYNLFLVKILIFEFFISLIFFINLLLYTDDNISYYYKEKGEYNFGHEFPMILASSFICIVLNMGIKLLMYNQKQIQKIKELYFLEQNQNLLQNKLEKFFAVYYLKIKIFSIVSSILLLIFFLYIVCFGSIFNESQVFFCVRLFLSFILSIIFPFIISFISSLLRIVGLKYQKKCIYDSSIFIQYL